MMIRCMLLLVFIILFSCVQLYIIDYSNDNSTLVLLHVIMRHGDRTPDSWNTYPYDPYKNMTYDPEGFGQLTIKGKTRIYNLGKYMRKKYNQFLGDYVNDAVYAKATNFKRTKATLETLLASLYPPTKDKMFNPEVKWQPIPYVYDKADDDIISIPYLYCANFLKHYYAYLMSEKGQKAVENFKDMYKNLTYYSGMSVTNPRQIGVIYAVLKGQDDWGLKIPNWAMQYWEEPFHIAAAIDYEISTVTPALIRLSAGRLLRKILEDTRLKIDKGMPKHRKINIYAGHEFNVATMMRALKVYFRHFPPYGAALFLEIHAVGDTYGMKILYEDYTASEPKVLTIPGCSTICPLEKIETMFKHHVATDDDVCFEANEL